MLLIFSLVGAQAADKYVRAGATGSGTGADWTNAYTNFNQVTTTGLSGFTIYVAAGTYTGDFPTFSNIDNWSMKRATVADHGTSTGWNAAYDGAVQHNGGKFLWLTNGCDNVTIDGGGTKEPWLFQVRSHNAANGKVLVQNGGNNITIRYIDFNGMNVAGTSGCATSSANEDGLRLEPGNNFVLEHCWVRNYWQCSTVTSHSDAIQMAVGNFATFRYNKFQDSGMLLFVGECEAYGVWVNNLHVHHNIFYQSSASLGANEDNYRLMCFKGVGEAGVSTPPPYTIIESNTFYSVGFSGGTISEDGACEQSGRDATRRVFRNNIFAPASFSGSVATGGSATGWNNSFGGGAIGSNSTTSNPLFVDVTTQNFRLQSGSPAASSGTSAALGFGTTLTVDYDGNPLPVGPTRARGAFEPAATGDPLPAIISATINAAGTQVAIVFSEAVTVGAGGANGWVLNLSSGNITIPSQTPSGTGTTRTYTFSSVRTVGQGETGSIIYTQPGNGIEDSALQDLPTGSTATVTNNSTVPTTATPSFSPVAGSYFGTQNVTITSSTSGATIRYTIDGSDPTALSTLYTAPIPTSISTNYKAKAFAATFLDSAITSVSYEIGSWSVSGPTWKTFVVPQQTGTFTWSFRASASQAAQDGIVALSPIAATQYADLGPVIRFGPSGNIDAHQNAGTYAAVNPFPYTVGTTYEFVVTVNIASRTFSATVAQIAGTPVTIATNYNFRSGATVVTELDNAVLYAASGGLTVSQMSFGTVSGTIPTLTSATIGSTGSTLTLVFSVPVGYGLGGNGGWTMSASGGAVTLTPTASPTSFTTSRPIAVGESGTISYTQPVGGNGVEASSGGGDLEQVSSHAFNNQSTVDLTSPTPNPMSFSSPPSALSSFSVTMTASLATDASTPPVEYFFDETSGNPGGTDSNWQSSRTYTNSNLNPGIQYTYRVLARDSASTPNQTTPSTASNVTTPIIAGGKVITPTKQVGAAFVNP